MATITDVDGKNIGGRKLTRKKGKGNSIAQMPKEEEPIKLMDLFPQKNGQSENDNHSCRQGPLFDFDLDFDIKKFNAANA